MATDDTNGAPPALQWVAAPRNPTRHLVAGDQQLTLCGLIPLYRSRHQPPADPCRVCLRQADLHGWAAP